MISSYDWNCVRLLYCESFNYKISDGLGNLDIIEQFHNNKHFMINNLFILQIYIKALDKKENKKKENVIKYWK